MKTIHSASLEAVAQMFIDAAPEDAQSANEYDWHLMDLSRDLIDGTGLHHDFREHARNIGLNPARSDLTRPVIVSMGDGERHPVAVWDGVHRIMSAMALGRDALPAIVGIRKMHHRH